MFERGHPHPTLPQKGEGLTVSQYVGYLRDTILASRLSLQIVLCLMPLLAWPVLVLGFCRLEDQLGRVHARAPQGSAITASPLSSPCTVMKPCRRGEPIRRHHVVLRKMLVPVPLSGVQCTTPPPAGE